MFKTNPCFRVIITSNWY